MQTYETTFHGLPVTVNYASDLGELEIVSVEWRDLEIQDAITQEEFCSIYGEMEMNLQADLFDAADVSKQAEMERKGEWRRAA